jgi:hypothetical protein
VPSGKDGFLKKYLIMTPHTVYVQILISYLSRCTNQGPDIFVREKERISGNNFSAGNTGAANLAQCCQHLHFSSHIDNKRTRVAGGWVPSVKF